MPANFSGLDSVAFSFFFSFFSRAEDLFLNIVTEGGQVGIAVIIFEKPSNNRINGDRKSIPDLTGKPNKNLLLCHKHYLCIAVSTVNGAAASLCPAEKSKRFFFTLTRNSVIGGRSPGNTKEKELFSKTRPPDYALNHYLVALFLSAAGFMG